MTPRQYKNKYKKLIIALVLLITPILGLIYLFYVNKTYAGTDITFHWQRLMELHYDIEHGILPQFMTHAESPLGTAFNIFYPYEYLLPFALLTFIFKKPLSLIYAVYTCIWITISLISYFSAKSYFRSRRTGLLFSFFYTACSTIGNTMILNADYGQSLSYSVLPLILFGYLWIIKDGSHWTMLCVGISLLIFSHVLTLMLMITALSILSILNIRRIFLHLKIIMSFLKAIITTTLITSIMWLPFIYIIQHNNYYNPKYGSHVAFWMSGLLWCRSGAFIHENCGFIDGIGILVGLMSLIYILFHRYIKYSWINIRIPKLDWQIWSVGMFFWLCNTNLWIIHHIFATTALNVFQFSFRTSLPLHVCFTFIAVKWLAGYYNLQRIHPLKFKRIIIFLLAVLALFMQIGNQLNDKLIYQQRATYYSSRESNFGAQQMKIIAHHPQGRGFTLDNNSYKHMLFTKILSDYQPMSTVPKKNDSYTNLNYFQSLANIVNTKSKNPQGTIIPTELTRRGALIKVPHNVTNLTVPLIYYNGYPYYVTNFGKRIHWIRNKGANFVELIHVNKGKYLLQIHPRINSNTRYALILTTLGAVLLLCSIGKYFIQIIIDRKLE